MIAANPFGDREDTKASSFQVTFLKQEPEALLEVPHTSERGDYEVLAIRDRAIYSVIDETGKTPDVMRLLETHLREGDHDEELEVASTASPRRWRRPEGQVSQRARTVVCWSS